MEKLERIIFVAKSGNCREPMAMGILKDISFKSDVEILARGLVVSFPEPINRKAEAVMISNGITFENFSSKQLKNEDITPDTLILTMEEKHRKKVLENYSNSNIENVYVLTDFVGDQLEILDPYGGSLQSYGLCYETLRQSLKKLVKILN